METAWRAYEFLKRNRGKILVAGTVTGGVLLAKHLYNSQQREPETPHVDSEQVASARCQYVFDSNHRSCETKIVELIPSIRNLLENYYNVEYLITMLRSETLNQTEKVEIWGKLKVLSIARVVAAAYSYTALVHVMKCQMSIVSAGIYRTMQSASSRPQNSGWLSYLPESVSSQLLGNDSLSEAPSHTAQEVFLRCIHYFTSTGISQLFEAVHNMTSEAVKDVDLTAKFTSTEVNSIFTNLFTQLEALDLAKFVVPGFGENARLNELLVRLVVIIQSEKFQNNLRNSLDPFLDTAMASIIVAHGTSEAKPLAKIIPTIADAFFHVAAADFDSPVQNSICSSELYRLSKDVYNANILDCTNPRR
uniref:Peroxisomal biogenesis factor 3 n=1 Tax=Steinernema glaseri TaxID=37863 RepID=A0A1I8A4Y1_9BILA